MKLSTVLSPVAVAVAVALALVVGCAPDQPPVTSGCTSVTQCALGEVCDREKNACIAEPADRFVGGFECTILKRGDAPTAKIELSEVIGRIGIDRWSLPAALCDYNEASDLLLIQFTSVSVVDSSLAVYLTASKARAGRVELGIDVDNSRESASMTTGAAGLFFGASSSGHVTITGGIAGGSTIKGYIDVAMIKTTRNVPFSQPCPRGRADCGELSSEAGGASMCRNIRTKDPNPICTLSCESNSDCAALDGVCLANFCLHRCTSDADCTAPSRCASGPDPAAGNGCY